MVQSLYKTFLEKHTVNMEMLLPKFKPFFKIRRLKRIKSNRV